MKPLKKLGSRGIELYLDRHAPPLDSAVHRGRLSVKRMVINPASSGQSLQPEQAIYISLNIRVLWNSLYAAMSMQSLSLRCASMITIIEGEDKS